MTSTVQTAATLETEILASVIHSHFEEDYGIDLEDAEGLAEKLSRLGWHRDQRPANAQLEERIARLERYARGEPVTWEHT